MSQPHQIATTSFRQKIIFNLKMYWFLYILVLPGLIHTVLFRLFPLYGVTIAFKQFQMSKGIWRSPWVGLQNFRILLQDATFYRTVWNTVLINLYSIAVGTFVTILLALMLNELRVGWIRKSLQTVVYFPNFISWVVYAGIVGAMLAPSDGAVNIVLRLFGLKPIYFLANNNWIRTVLVASSLIKTAGFSTIIYLASIAGVNPELFEGAIIDGANRGHLIRYIILPRIMPTIAVLLIMSVSNLFHSNFEQVFNLINPLVYDKGDVLSTYLYRTGLVDGKFEQAAALGLAYSVIGLLTVVGTNKLVRRMDVIGFF